MSEQVVRAAREAVRAQLRGELRRELLVEIEAERQAEAAESAPDGAGLESGEVATAAPLDPSKVGSWREAGQERPERDPVHNPAGLTWGEVRESLKQRFAATPHQAYVEEAMMREREADVGAGGYGYMGRLRRPHWTSEMTRGGGRL